MENITDGALLFKSQSAAVQQALRQACEAASQDGSFLITGESGTGKSILACFIYQRSSRRQEPFQIIDFASVTEHLIASELFGHKKGAFTGAVDNKTGLLEQAHKGTLFLDEIGTMPPPMQTKLLTFLDTQTFTRMGETKPVKVDVRVIAATNEDLWRCVQEKTFREDLFHRLNVINLYLPPLRERMEELPDLLELYRCELNVHRRDHKPPIRSYHP